MTQQTNELIVTQILDCDLPNGIHYARLMNYVAVCREEKEIAKKVGIGGSLVGLFSLGGLLCLGAISSPMTLIPLATVAYAAYKTVKSDRIIAKREFEEEFLEQHPQIIQMVNYCLREGADPEDIADSYKNALRTVWADGQKATLLPNSEFHALQAQSEEQPPEPIAPLYPIGQKTKLEAIEVPLQDASTQKGVYTPPMTQNTPQNEQAILDLTKVLELPLRESETRRFDWKRLNRDYDKFPHLFLLGDTGSGKSHLADRLIRFLEGYSLVITPKKHPKAFKGLPVVGLPYNSKEIYRTVTSLVQLMVDREIEMNATGEDNLTPVNVLLDELPVAIADCKDEGLDLLKPLKKLIRAGRSSRIRLIILAQGQEVKTLGIEGEGSLRDCLTYLYLGEFAEKQAERLKMDISGIPYPCLVEKELADSSQLERFISVIPQPVTFSGQKTEMLSPPVEEQPDSDPLAHWLDDAGQQVNPLRADLELAFPKWPVKAYDLAEKMISFLATKQRPYLASEVKASIRELKDGEITSDQIKQLLTVLAANGFVQEADGKFTAEG